MPFLLIQINFCLICKKIKDEVVRREAANKIRRPRDQCILNTEDETFPEVEENGERPHIDQYLLVPTNNWRKIQGC